MKSLTPQVHDGFEKRNRAMIRRMIADSDLKKAANDWLTASAKHEYSYHFSWLGRPIIQYPQDLVAMQEIIWAVKPDLIIETGVARGGSLIFYASLLELIGDGQVVGVDIDIRAPNRAAIKSHPMFKRITMVEGSSTDEVTARKIYGLAKDKARILLVLDSNHAHDHVLKEMQLYSPLVTRGSYMVVFDTVIEDMPAGSFPSRPWDKGNN
ncbi:MAG: cephalosporin hydroxylase family protein, partial [Terriglobia bacterium]